jgi:hypothetical protein
MTMEPWWNDWLGLLVSQRAVTDDYGAMMEWLVRVTRISEGGDKWLWSHDGTMIARGKNQRKSKKPRAPVSLRLQRNPHEVTYNWTRAPAVRSQCPATWATARSCKAIPVKVHGGHMVVRRRGSHIFYTIGSQMAVSLSALRAGPPAALYSPGIFLVLISVRGWVNPRAIVPLEGLGPLKNKIHLIGTRTRDLPACSTVPQPTTLPRAPTI